MKIPAVKGLMTILITLIALPFVSEATQLEKIPTALAIEVGSRTTRLSVVTDIGQPKIIFLGPGTQSAHWPSESQWTAEGFLPIKDGTDEALYVHPSNTLFNLQYPIAFTAKGLSKRRPNTPGYQTFTLADITVKYLKGLQTLAETIVGRTITSFHIITPGREGFRTLTEEIIGSDWRGNYTGLSTVISDENDFQESQKDALYAAWDVAGLERPIFRWRWRPFALAIGLDNGMEDNRKVLVYHIGSSTHQVSVLELDEGVFEIWAAVYDQGFGGDDFNTRVVNHLLLVHKKKTSEDPSSDDKFMIRLRREVEKAKQALSSQKSVRIEIESLHPGGQDLSEELTRSQFEDLNMDLFRRAIATIDRAIEDTDGRIKDKDDIQDVILSGGPFNIPFLRSAIKDYFGEKKRYHGLNHVETASVFGAATIGQRFERSSEETGICCFGVAPLSVGIETAGGVMFKFMDRNSDHSLDRMFTFSTAMDNQDRVAIRVFDGERALASQNTFLGGIELSGILPAPKGVPQIRVRLRAPSCGNSLFLTVMEVATERINSTTITPRSSYESDEIQELRLLEGVEFEYEDRLIWENAKATGTITLLNPE